MGSCSGLESSAINLEGILWQCLNLHRENNQLQHSVALQRDALERNNIDLDDN